MTGVVAISQQVIVAAAVLGSAAGIAVPLNNQSSAQVNAVFISYVATATVGNRNPTLTFKDSLGNILWQTAHVTSITASQTPKIMTGPGIVNASFTTPLMLMLELPSNFTLPKFASLTVFDAANIDVNDTAAVNVSLLF